MRISDQWTESYENYRQQVNTFTQLVKSNPTLEQLDDIYQVVQKEVKLLKKLAEEVQEKEKTLDKRRKWCCPTIDKKVYTSIALNVFAKIIEGTGLVLEVFLSNHVPSYTGTVIFGIGATVDIVNSAYEMNTYLTEDERELLAKINKDGIEQAKIFKKFIKEFKKIKQIGQTILKHSPPNDLSASEIDSLFNKKITEIILEKQVQEEPTSESALQLFDELIKKCIQNFEYLPFNFRQEDVYCRIISIVIDCLPQNDPLRREMDAFDNYSNQNLNISFNTCNPSPMPAALTEGPLEPNELEKNKMSQFDNGNQNLNHSSHDSPVNYLPSALPDALKNIPLDQSESNPWIYEQGAQQSSFSASQLSGPMGGLHPLKFASYKEKLRQRFHVFHNLAFLDTPQGHRIMMDSIDKSPFSFASSSSEASSSQKKQIEIPSLNLNFDK